MPEPDFDKRGGLLPAIAQDVRTGESPPTTSTQRVGRRLVFE